MAPSIFRKKNVEAPPESLLSRLLSIWGLVLLVPLFLLPVAFVLVQAFAGSSEGGAFDAFRELTASPYIWRVIRFSLLQSLFSMLVSLLIGIPGAIILAGTRFRGRFLIRALSAIPFMLPSIIVVLGFVMFWGNSGLLNTILARLFSPAPQLAILYSFKAIILAHAFYNFPIALSIVSSYMENLDNSQEAAAYSLGARPLRVFRTITLVKLAPAIISAASLIFLFCFTSFAIVLVLGGGPQFTTIEVEIYRQARISLSTANAASLAILSILISSLVLLVYVLSQRSMRAYTIGSANRRYLVRHGNSASGTGNLTARLLTGIYAAAVAVFTVGPILAIIIRSFQTRMTRGGALLPTFRWYTGLFSSSTTVSAVNALANSGILALGTVLLAVPAAVGIAFFLRRTANGRSVLSEVISMSPLAVSSVIIGLGYFIIAPRLHHRSAQWIVLVCSHAVIALPFIIRAVLPAVQHINPAYAKAALLLGAKPNRVFRTIELPLIGKAIASGIVFAIAISLGEIQSTMILADESTVTIPILLYRLIGSYNFFSACALGVVLMLLAIMFFAVVEYWREKV